MPVNCGHIVCFGKEWILLQTRKFLLEQAGYVVDVTLDPHIAAELLLSGDVGIIVLCHTVSKSDVEIVSKSFRERGSARERHSAVRMLCLSVGERTSELGCFRVHNVQRGPAAFLAEVGALLSTSGVACWMISAVE